ncbi:winged helix-turn-helix domain-containing protein [Micromonospora sp. WMMD730]|uniref:winged helix-turn-helix domain-containing protein n=1 Tax=Micromonospora sp. WMMD730 TaxID=3404128 RepID=UPI003B9444B8
MPTTPDYIRIADDVIAGVRSKRLNPDDKLPSIAKMAADYQVGTSTIQMVYVRLEALRVIRRHQGKGIFIADPRLWMREP